MDETKTAKAGKLLCLDKGEYSDYSVIGFFVVLQDFDPMAQLKEYLTDKPDEVDRYRFRPDAYVAYLLAQGLLMEVSYGTLYLGGYGSSDEVSFSA